MSSRITVYLNWKYGFRYALLIFIIKHKECITLHIVYALKNNSKRLDNYEDAKLDLIFVNTHGMKN